MVDQFAITMKKEDFENLINSAVSNAIGKFVHYDGDERLFTEEEATKYLKCSSVTLWQKRKEGKLKSMKSGRLNLYRKSALDTYLGLNDTGGSK